MTAKPTNTIADTMRQANSLHPDYAAYRIQQAEKWNHPDLQVAAGLCNVYEVRPLLQALAIEYQSELLAGIASTVAEIEDQREREGIRCRRKVTDKQRHALATALLEKYGSAREIVKAAWGLTDQQIDEAQV